MDEIRKSPNPTARADDPLKNWIEACKDFGITELYPAPPEIPPQFQELESVRLYDLGQCTRCKLHKSRKTIVYGEGNPGAELMLVGEAPGADEDDQGRPFVGRAGQLLMQMIRAIEFERSDVYIANILKCRPPENRPPEPDEVAQCSPFLLRQIAIIKPKIILALGSYAAQTLLRSKSSISFLRNRIYEMDFGRVIATYHPSFLLRTPQKKVEAWEDLKLVKRTLQET